MKLENIYPRIRTVKSGEDIYNLDLYYQEEFSDNTPKITFASPEDEIIRDISSADFSGSDLIKQSFSNLKEISISVSDGQVNGQDYLHFDSEYASEKILDKDFIKEIENHFSEQSLLISIPARNTMLVCNSTDVEASQQLIQCAQKIYHDFSKEAISQLVFEVESGLIQTAYTPKTTFDTTEEHVSVGSYKEELTKVKLFQELYNLRLLVEADTMQDLQNGMLQSVLSLLKNNERNENFKRKIEIVSSSNELKRSAENIEKINALFERIAEVYEMKRKESLNLTFQFHSDFKNGNNHNKLIKTI